MKTLITLLFCLSLSMSYANDFTKEKWHKLLESIGKYNVSHHDWRSKKKQDSYILKIWKHT